MTNLLMFVWGMLIGDVLYAILKNWRNKDE